MSTTVSRETSSKSTPSLDFIAGVVETHGCFFWQKTGKRATPFFRIKIHRAQAPLLSSISTKLGLCGNIYRYSHGGRKYAMLVVRRRSEIADKLIPALDGRLLGSKRKEYEKWRDRFHRIALRRL